MPIFKDPVEIIEIKGLKNYPDLIVKMASTLTAQDAINIGKTKGAENIIDMLVCLIKDWNMEEKEGVKLAITKENLMRFSLEDIMEIFGLFNKATEDVKKNPNESAPK